MNKKLINAATEPLRLFNTMSREKEVFVPVDPGQPVRMYNCGPTVYNFAHIGNLRAFVFADTLRRTLEANGYEVKQVINITDVGHLVSDGDEGQDKMTKGLEREGLPITLAAMQQLGEKFFTAFKGDLEKLHIKKPSYFPKASEHIKEDIALIEILESKGFTYKTADGIYFATDNLSDYGKLAGKQLTEDDNQARVENDEKKNPRDFALWKFNNRLGWKSPWGQGFPGWHIECSVMSMQYLGESFDIHTGGIDHITVHHTNEIAQSESATGKPMARFWLHNAFLTIEDEKISKSLGNDLYLSSIEKQGYSPLTYRYLLLSARYRTQINFSWQALDSANQALQKLYIFMR
ncbi:MAG: cysteine--tRNA ligase, partial [Candidatus Paceibacterota bacterium]